jgi:Putative redox-active protein (C_GCAxxG_C_C)
MKTPKTLSRRQALTLGGLTLGAALTGRDIAATESTDETKGTWKYCQLDPKQVAEKAYEYYPVNSCMYAVVRGVLEVWSETSGQSVDSFPFDMMAYGHGGVGGYGSLCGVCNGMTAMVGLFLSPRTKEEKKIFDAHCCELLRWCESSALPKFKPADKEKIPLSRSGSVLCHVSIKNWADKADEALHSPERKERCRRLSADGAARVTKLLNRHFAGACPKTCEIGLSDKTRRCIECHGKGSDLEDAYGKMDCGSCHKFDDGEHFE